MITDDQGNTEGAEVPVRPGGGRDTADIARRYKAVIARYDQTYQTWRRRSRKIEDIYLEQRTDAERISQNRKFAMLWSNVQTLQPAIYQRLPHPVVGRKFRDDDQVARVAGEILERCISSNNDKIDLDSVVRQVRDDYLLVGRGTVWVRYEPEISSSQIEGLEAPAEQIEDETVHVDYVAWGDFGHNVARTWAEVTCVWRRTFLTRDEGVKRFGEAFKDVPLDHKLTDEDNNGDQRAEQENKATVYEIWNKVAQEVCWIAKDHPDVLEVGQPPLEFERFFPCPRPLYGTLSNRSLIPIPDYVYYQDQCEEIDELTQRIGKLTDALKVVGFYASGDEEVATALQTALKPGVENQLIPIPNWGKFKEGGGAAGNIEYWPVEQVAKVLQSCFETRKQLVQDVYEITGISDIVRGESDPNETATAQQIKSQWGSVRVRDRQMELARFLRDIGRLVGEVIAEQFQPQTLMDMSNIHLPSEQPVMLPPLALPGFEAAQGAPSLPETAPPPPGVAGALPPPQPVGGLG